jgi:predicted GNAT superfamily acetyltransferase
MAESEIQLRFLHDQDDIRTVVDLQREVWGDDLTVPDHLLLASIHGGGLLIGAFDGEEMVGFVYGFPAFDQGDAGPVWRHHSHMLAVVQGKRDMGIGFGLKRAQWQWVRQQGLERITWTFDPLEPRDAEDAADGDAMGQRRLLVRARGSHRHTQLGAADE